MIYKLKMEGPGPESAVFVSLCDRPVEDKIYTMYVVRTVREDTRTLSFDHIHSNEQHTLIHVDSITSKIKLVPHYDVTKRTTHMCGIRMWYAR